MENAKAEAEAMISSARTAIQAERDKALGAIRKEVVDLSIHAATKVLGRNVGGEDDRRLADQVVAGSAGKGSKS